MSTNNPEKPREWHVSELVEKAVVESDFLTLSKLLNKIDIRYYTDVIGYSLLHFAAPAGNIKMTKYFIDSKCNVNIKCKEGNTPLLLTLVEKPNKNTTEIVKLLLRAGADLDERNFMGADAFYLCFREDSEPDNLEVAELLLDAGVKVDTQDLFKITPLRTAIYSRRGESVNFLLKHNANLNKKDENDSTPLHDSVTYSESLYIDHTDFNKQSYFIWQCLLSSGANVNAQDTSGKTPFHLLLEFGTIESVELFFKYEPDLLMRDNNGKSSIHYASVNNDCRILDLLIKKGCDCMAKTNKSRIALHSAVKIGRIENVVLLCKAGSDINSSDKEGNSPLLRFAKLFTQLDKMFTLFERQILMEVMIDFGADVNARNNDGQSIMDLISNKSAILFFVELFAKLEFLGKHTVDEHQMNIISSMKKIQVYYNKCSDELLEIKKFDNHLPILKFITGEMDVMDHYRNNPSHVVLFNALDFKRKFPIYGSFIYNIFKMEMMKESEKIETVLVKTDQNENSLPLN